MSAEPAADTGRVAHDDAQSRQSPLRLVRERVHPASGADEANVWRTAMRGYVIGFVAATIGIATVGTLTGLGLGPSLGFGAFIGIFGGGGFGFMTAASMSLAHHLDGPPAPPTRRQP